MIEINLLPEGMRKKESIRISLPDVPIKKTLLIGFGIFFALQALFTVFVFYLRYEDFSTRQRLASLKEMGKEAQRQKTETADMNERLKQARLAATHKFYWASLLNALSNGMTKGVWIRTMYVTEEEPKTADRKVAPEPAIVDKKVHDKYFVLEGSAVGQGQETAFIGKFLKQLKDDPQFSELFSDIKPININQRRLKEYDVYDFMIYGRFRKEKAS